jgi:phospholipid/cholesterol/gamma-HCH transport system permease protein
MGETIRQGIAHAGGISILFLSTLRHLFSRPFEADQIMNQLHRLGVRSLSITAITGVFTGMVLALEATYTLAGGWVGAGITAELGTMAVTEQVDAIRALGADPVKKLVLPRVVATLIMLPALTVIADLLGILGGMVIGIYEIGQTSAFYINQVITTLTFRDVLTGTGKTPFFALIIALVACYNGLKASGGADGVGRATTRTVVTASIMILVSNFFLTKFFFIIL